MAPLSHLDDPTMDNLVQAVASRLRMSGHHHGSGSRWNLERWLTVVTFVASVCAICFTAGLNWSDISRLKSDLAAHQRESADNFVRKDVLQLELRNLRGTIEILNSQLEQHTRALERVEGRAR